MLTGYQMTAAALRECIDHDSPAASRRGPYIGREDD